MPATKQASVISDEMCIS